MCPVVGSGSGGLTSSENETEGDMAENSDSEASNSSFESSSSSSSSDSDWDGTFADPGASTSKGPNSLNEDEDEEDEVVKAIIREKNKVRDHPPDIECEDFVTDICFHPKEDILVVATLTGDAIIYKYSNDSNEICNTLELHMKACRDIEFDEDGMSLYSSSKDKSILISDLATGKLKNAYEHAHDVPVYSLLVLDPNIFASGDDDGTVKLWDTRQRNAVFSMKEMEDYVSSMITNEDQRHLVCASGDGTLTSLNIRMRTLQIQSEPYKTELTSLATIKHERKVVVGTSKGSVYLFNWGEFGYHIDEFPGTKHAINSLVPITENIIVTACDDGMLRATHICPHRHLGVAGQHKLPVEHVDICNDGHLIASFGHDNFIKFWSINYFEHVAVNGKKKAEKKKDLTHNLPSSKFKNASDFFSDLA